MLLRTRSCYWVTAVLATTLCATAAGCGFYDMEERASAAAAENLSVQVAETIECVRHGASDLLTDASTSSLAEGVSDCADTQILNQDVSQAPSNTVLPFTQSSVAVTGVLTADALDLGFLTQATGVADAGISNARVYLSTCWKVVVDNNSGRLREVSSAPCDEEVVARTHTGEHVPFEDLDLADP